MRQTRDDPPFPLDASSKLTAGMPLNEVDWHWLYLQTCDRLAVHEKRVREGKGLDAALEFAQYVQWSGIVKILTAHSRPEPLKVDGPHLKWMVGQLEELVRAHWKNEKVPVVELTELERINHKLDLIAGHMGRMIPAEAVSAPSEPVEAKILQFPPVTT